jgi:hypothetical protein
MIAEVSQINMDKVAHIVNRDGWDSDDPIVIAYNTLQFPREGRSLHKGVLDMFSQSGYMKVADIVVDESGEISQQLEYVFERCQNIFQPWTENDVVVNTYNGAENGCRSLSVGDTVRLGERLFVVARFGFEEV